MATWCSGWKASSNSFGRTSKPQVSVAIAAISLWCSQSAVVKDKPGRRAAGVLAPPLAAGASELAGAHQDDVAATDGRGRSLPLDGLLEVSPG